jgi:uncharacterized protein (DUF2147 family)
MGLAVDSLARARVVLASLLVLSAPAPASSQITGAWLTDVRDGVVDIRSCGGGLMCGYIQSILKDYGRGAAVRDELNENVKLRSRPICGLPILGKLKQLGPNTWGEGWVYDPKRGKTFSVEVTLTRPGTLSVRGYKGVKMFGQTVVWTRAAPNLPRCK